MPINSRRKGKRGELEVAALLRRHGIPARRGIQYEGGGGSPDIRHALDAIVHFEVKLTTRIEIEDWYDQAAVDGAYRVPVVLHRISSRKLSTPWRATLSAAHLAMLLGHERWPDLERGSPRAIAGLTADLPLSVRIVQAHALRFEREFGAAMVAATADRPAALLHSRIEHDALWMASLDAVALLGLLVAYAEREYGYQSRIVEEYTPELEREYDVFWQTRRDLLARNLPLFKGVA